MSDAFETDEDHGQLQAAHHSLGRVAADLASSRTAVTKDVGRAIETWKGPRSTRFTRASGGVQIQLRHAHDACAEVATILGEYARAVADAQDELDGLKRQHDAVLKDDHDHAGSDPTGTQALEHEMHRQRRAQTFADMALDTKKDLHRKAARYAERVEKITSKVAPRGDRLSAADIRREVTGHMGVGGHHDKDMGIREALSLLQAAVSAAPRGSVNDDGSVNWSKADDLDVDLPKDSATPSEVHNWWKGLSPREQNFLLHHHPSKVGNRDGIPVVDRDYANRIVLAEMRKKMREKMHDRFPDGEPEKERLLHNYAGPKTMHNKDWDRWHHLKQLIDTNDDLTKKLHGSSDPPYYLIGYQPLKGNGRAIVSQGNPDTATNTSIFVPGMTSKYTGIGEGMRKSVMMRQAARKQGADPESLATVTWVGYDAPQDLPEAAHLGYAEDGAPLLDSFATGLRATHQDGYRSHTTVVSHSYGTTTAGWAASHGHTLHVDDLVMVASPGAGVGHGWVDREPTSNGIGTSPAYTDATVKDLDLDGSSTHHVFATRSKGDPIRAVDDTHLGVDPTNPAFGATTFGADPEGGHSDYWNKVDGPSLTAMGQVIAGQGSRVKPPTLEQTVHPRRFEPPILR